MKPLELLLSKFRLFLVEETVIVGTNHSKLVVQFENQDAIDQFNRERALWESDSHEETIITYAKRRDLFNCIDTIRCMTREDRVGKRLKSFIENKPAEIDFL